MATVSKIDKFEHIFYAILSTKEESLKDCIEKDVQQKYRFTNVLATCTRMSNTKDYLRQFPELKFPPALNEKYNSETLTTWRFFLKTQQNIQLLAIIASKDPLELTKVLLSNRKQQTLPRPIRQDKKKKIKPETTDSDDIKQEVPEYKAGATTFEIYDADVYEWFDCTIIKVHDDKIWVKYIGDNGNTKTVCISKDDGLLRQNLFLANDINIKKAAKEMEIVFTDMVKDEEAKQMFEEAGTNLSQDDIGVDNKAEEYNIFNAEQADLGPFDIKSWQDNDKDENNKKPKPLFDPNAIYDVD